MARTPKAAEDKRVQRRVGFSPQEWVIVCDAAKNAGMETAPYIRAVALRQARADLEIGSDV